MESNLAIGDDVVLPSEILRIIMIQLGNVEGLKELKKCRLISQKFYEAVQNSYENDFGHKFKNHFNGLRYSSSYTADAAQFGQNIFGESKLNFPTLRISHSEIYLLKTWLGNMILTNIQTLGLYDNVLNWREIIQVLKKFKNVVNLTFAQTSRRSEQLHMLFHYDFNPDLNDSEMIEKIKYEVGDENDDFLPNLKLLKMTTIHPKIMNIFSMIIAQAVKCKLKDLIIIVQDLPALNKSLQFHPKRSRDQELSIRILKHLVGFSGSLKTLYVSVPNNDSEIEDFRKEFCFIFMKMFSILENYLGQYRGFEKIVIYIIGFSFILEEYQFLDFIQNQDNLKILNISWITDQFNIANNNNNREIIKGFKRLVKPNATTIIDFYFAINHGLEPILDFPNNLKIIDLELKERLWRFSDNKIPIFPKCLFLGISIKHGFSPFNQWPDFDVQGIVQKFPSLDHLYILDCSIETEHNPCISNDDLQLIIRNYRKIMTLNLHYCCRNLGDAGITGLTNEALELRKNDRNLPLRLEEFSGLPICQLKKLEELTIYKEVGDQIQITDLSIPSFALMMDKLKKIELKNTKISPAGFQVLEFFKNK